MFRGSITAICLPQALLVDVMLPIDTIALYVCVRSLKFFLNSMPRIPIDVLHALHIGECYQSLKHSLGSSLGQKILALPLNTSPVVSSCKSHELYEVYIYKYLLITKYIQARYSQLEVPGF